MQKDEQEEVNDAPAGGDAPVQETADETSAHIKEDLLGYTVAELTKFAEENGIDLQGKTRKADIYNVIVAHFQ